MAVNLTIGRHVVKGGYNLFYVTTSRDYKKF